MIVTPHGTLLVHTDRVRVTSILWVHPSVRWHISECVGWLKGKMLVPEGILESFPGEMALSLDLSLRMHRQPFPRAVWEFHIQKLVES